MPIENKTKLNKGRINNTAVPIKKTEGNQCVSLISSG